MNGERDAVIEIMGSLFAQLDELVAQVGGEVWATIDDYPDAIADRSEFDQVVHRNLHAVLTATTHRRPIGAAELEASIQLGEARATQGVPIASLLLSFRSAERCLVTSFLAAAGEIDGQTCGVGVRLLSSAIDQLERASVDAYRRMVRQVVLEHEATVSSLISRLASGAAIDPAILLHEAAIIGVDPVAEYVGVAILIPAEIDPLRVPKLRRQVASRISELVRSKVPSVGWHGSLLLIVPHGVPIERLMGVLETVSSQPPHDAPLIIGVGPVADGLVAMGESLRQAVAAARSSYNTAGRGNVIHYPEVALEVLLASNPDVARTLVDYRVGGLVGNDQLRTTLELYLESGRSIKRTAETMQLHPNTVAYRLKRIEELLHVDLHDPQDLTIMDIAVLASRVLHRESNVRSARSSLD